MKKKLLLKRIRKVVKKEKDPQWQLGRSEKSCDNDDMLGHVKIAEHGNLNKTSCALFHKVTFLRS